MVLPNEPFPKKMSDLLTVNQDKNELFKYLADCIHDTPAGLYIGNIFL